MKNTWNLAKKTWNNQKFYHSEKAGALGRSTSKYCFCCLVNISVKFQCDQIIAFCGDGTSGN